MPIVRSIGHNAGFLLGSHIPMSHTSVLLILARISYSRAYVGTHRVCLVAIHMWPGLT